MIDRQWVGIVISVHDRERTVFWSMFDHKPIIVTYKYDSFFNKIIWNDQHKVWIEEDTPTMICAR